MEVTGLSVVIFLFFRFRQHTQWPKSRRHQNLRIWTSKIERSKLKWCFAPSVLLKLVF